MTAITKRGEGKECEKCGIIFLVEQFEDGSHNQGRFCRNCLNELSAIGIAFWEVFGR